jgi:BirA family transcriptional regulator, biotin operon repressor / biotin---[acetyl-CoA-carboxylase] ligase
LPQPFETKVSDVSFIELQSVDSTNNYAMACITEGVAQHGITYFTHEQSAGKAQRGKIWISEKGANIMMSMVIKPLFLQPSEQFKLSACVAVALLGFFKRYAGDQTKIKWPNDIYWRDRKAAGVLIENIISSGKLSINNWQWAILGIGVNLNQVNFPSDLQNPVSLKQITGGNYNPIDMAKELCETLNLCLIQLEKEGGDSIFETYNRNLYKKNEKVRIKKGSRVFEATVTGVSSAGQLIVNHGMEERFDFGDIELIVG